MDDVTPDGKRFVVFPNLNTSAEEKGAVHIAYLQNFFDELRRRVPVGKWTSCSQPLHRTCVPQIPLDKSGLLRVADQARRLGLIPGACVIRR